MSFFSAFSLPDMASPRPPKASLAVPTAKPSAPYVEASGAPSAASPFMCASSPTAAPATPVMAWPRATKPTTIAGSLSSEKAVASPPRVPRRALTTRCTRPPERSTRPSPTEASVEWRAMSANPAAVASMRLVRRESAKLSADLPACASARSVRSASVRMWRSAGEARSSIEKTLLTETMPAHPRLGSRPSCAIHPNASTSARWRSGNCGGRRSPSGSLRGR